MYTTVSEHLTQAAVFKAAVRAANFIGAGRLLQLCYSLLLDMHMLQAQCTALNVCLGQGA